MSDDLLLGRHPAAGAGSVDRERPIVKLTGLGSWRGAVTVTPIARQRLVGRRYTFEVRAEWVGPPLPNPMLPDAGDGEPIDQADLMLVPDVELAKSLAGAAAELLKRDRVPDLRRLRESALRRA
jgi:hypothetical protein